MTRVVCVGDELDRFRAAARRLLAAHVPPHDISFVDDDSAPRGLFDDGSTVGPAEGVVRVPRDFIPIAERVACHRDPSRWALLYRLLWRASHGEPRVFDTPTDPDLRAVERLDSAVRRDLHKARAFTRFVKTRDDEGERYLAWHGAEHRVLRLDAGFYVDRFNDMRWSILTPHEAAWWDGTSLTFGPGVSRREAERALEHDGLEELWRSYYASTFNPARLRPTAMKRELPRKHWATLPEADLIADLVLGSVGRATSMSSVAPSGASAFVPRGARSLAALREAAVGCRGCELCEAATQTVFGEGSTSAQVVLVGEQPGDLEDREGRPFVGPAGAVLDQALSAAGVPREALYLTNAVKHFRHRVEGKRRMHATPRVRDVADCKPWLDAEVEVLSPRVIVALGRTAARALLGPAASDEAMGSFHPDAGGASLGVIVTWHPAAILRAPDPGSRDERAMALRDALSRAWAMSR